MLLKIPVPLLLPAWSVAALGLEPSPDEKRAPVEPAAAKYLAIDLPILLQEICGPILGIYKSLTDT